MNINGHRRDNIILHRGRVQIPLLNYSVLRFILSFLALLAAASITMDPISMLYMHILKVKQK